MPKWVDRSGVKYGMLTACEYLGNRMWLCKCDCGAECVRVGSRLNDTSHCGCQKKERDRAAGLKRTRHGDSRSKLYKRWTAMLQRCENQNNTAYANYGGRCIAVCEEWHSYDVFRDWSISNGFRDGLTLDRIDVDGDYCPENCRWTNYSTQLSNRRPYHRKELWKPVEALDDNGNVVGRFDRIDDAINWLGAKTKCGTGISHALNGDQKTAYGYTWRYADADA